MKRAQYGAALRMHLCMCVLLFLFPCKFIKITSLQVRANHIDGHYCAASWRYLREYAILNKELVALVSLDDKHKVKCGEPSYPLAAAERGKKVIVGPNQTMAVGDHDFSKCSITPSVTFLVSRIPTATFDLCTRTCKMNNTIRMNGDKYLLPFRLMYQTALMAASIGEMSTSPSRTPSYSPPPP